MIDLPEIRIVFRGQGDRQYQDSVSLSALLDEILGAAQGTVMFRGDSVWEGLDPGVSDGLVLTSGGPNADVYWSAGGSGYAAPAFSAFAIAGQAAAVEVGATIGGSVTFTWSTSNSSNVKPNSISIVDTTTSTTLDSGHANSGSDALTIGSIANNSPASHVWTINGVNTNLGTFSRAYSVAWEWRVYAGNNSAATLTANQIKALSASSGLRAGFAGTYTITSGSVAYYYFSYPDSMGDVAYFVDGNTGFPISMATAGDDAAYSNTANGWSYDLVSVTNGNSVATNYRVYRTQYPFSGTLKMIVS